jgi:plasmid stabilization system protein ParE
MSVSPYRVELGPVAEEDAETAFRWLLKRNPLHAVEWYDGLVDTIESLSRRPERCARAPEDKRRRRGIRQLLYGRGATTFRILVVVKKDEKLVHVLRLRHGARRRLRWKDLFIDEES